MGFSNDSKCPHCPHVIDDYFHAVWLCAPLQSFCSEVMAKLSQILGLSILSSPTVFLLGDPLSTSPHIYFNSINRSYCSVGKIALNYPLSTGSSCKQKTPILTDSQQPYGTKWNHSMTRSFSTLGADQQLWTQHTCHICQSISITWCACCLKNCGHHPVPPSVSLHCVVMWLNSFAVSCWCCSVYYIVIMSCFLHTKKLLFLVFCINHWTNQDNNWICIQMQPTIAIIVQFFNIHHAIALAQLSNSESHNRITVYCQFLENYNFPNNS